MEKLQEDLIVLHSFEYTHFQYQMNDSSHDKRKCTKCKKMATNREGESDFVVIAPNYFVIIEVKNMGHMGDESKPGCDSGRQLKALAGTFHKSIKQRNNLKELVKRFCKRLTVLQFTAYPNFQKKFIHEFELKTDQMSTIIFEEDLEEFGCWWNDNVADPILNEPLRTEFRLKREEVRNLFLAIWCTDKKDCDKAKCSLGRCILNIDEQLRSGKFNFRRNNPEVFPTPSLYKEFLGVDNLTKQQCDLITSPEKFLWINGPAGAGKTIVLMAKILQLVLSKRQKGERAILFCGTNGAEAITSSNAEQKQKILEKAGVKHVTIDVEMGLLSKPSEFYHKIIDHLEDNQVVIVLLWGTEIGGMGLIPVYTQIQIPPWHKNIFKSLQGINLFFDDIHNMLHAGSPGNNYEVIVGLPELSKSHYVWVTNDLVQTSGMVIDAGVHNVEYHHFNPFFTSKLPQNQFNWSVLLRT